VSVSSARRLTQMARAETSSRMVPSATSVLTPATRPGRFRCRRLRRDSAKGASLRVPPRRVTIAPATSITRMPEHGRLALAWIGHSTVLLELDGKRFLTDPLLRTRVAHLRRAQPIDATKLGSLDAVLISHGHYDHLDVPSLRKLDPSVPVLAPARLASVLRRSGRLEIVEARLGDELTFGGVTVRATPAEHRGSGGLRRGEEAVGFLLRGSASVYFAGDTDLFDGMRELAPVDLALLPVWGWGKSLGEGHLDPQRAAKAASLLQARFAVPIHWGTYRPLHHRAGAAAEPAQEFRRAVMQVAPETRVEILSPGETLALASVGAIP
jgi:L-ascorbate metabolism protein UlaG (beta-lactamase superfamily)